MIPGKKRRFAEQSVVKFPQPSEEEIREAEERVGPLVVPLEDNTFTAPWFPALTFASSVLVYVCLPAILAAIIGRGGLVMLACGVAVTGPDGARASRLRCLWRSLITWSPWLVGLVLLVILGFSIGFLRASIAVGGLALALTIVSLWLPVRSLQDRLAGTCLVPR